MPETTTLDAPGERGMPAPVSLLRRAVAWVGVVGISAAAAIGLALADVAPPSAAGGAAAAFVPPDGAVALVTADDGSRTVHEHARDTGPSILLEAPALAAAHFFNDYSEEQLRLAQLWRETVASPDDATVAQTAGVYLLDARGVSLLTSTGGEVGFTYTPGLVVLPADAAPGTRWEGEGTALPGELLDYSMSGELTAADEPGCILASTSVSYVDPSTDAELVRVEEEATWCPGRGVVADVQRVGEETFSVVSGELPGDLASAALRTAPSTPDWSGAADWRARSLTFRLLDPSYGESVLGSPMDGPVATLADGTLVSSASSRLSGFSFDGTTATRVWQAAPGGDLIGLSAVGDVALAATTERRLVAYDARGLRLWSLVFPDAVLATPTATGDGDVVAVSIDGTVRRVDLATGEPVWSVELRTDVDAAPAVVGDLVVLVDRGGVVTARALADGTDRWSTELPDAGVVAAAGRTLAAQSMRGSVWLLDPDDGTVRWRARQFGVGQRLVVIDGLVVSQTDEGTEAWHAQSGELLWSDAGTEGLLTDGSRVVVAGVDRMSVRSADGRVEAEVPVDPGVPTLVRTLVSTPDGVRLIQTDGTGTEVSR